MNNFIDTKICLDQSKDYIQSLENIQNYIQNIKEKYISTLQLTENNKTRIQKNSGELCYQNILKQNENNINNTINLYGIIRNKKNEETKKLINTITNKQKCNYFINKTNEINIINKELENLMTNNIYIQNTIKSKNNTKLKLICNHTKHDGEINKTNQNIQKLINNLKNLNKNDNQKNSSTSNNNTKIINTKQEQNLLNQENIKQKERIENMLNIKSQKNYNINYYLDNLFLKFYGNNEDFK